jgi:hypothetical protein
VKLDSGRKFTSAQKKAVDKAVEDYNRFFGMDGDD